MVKGKLRKQKKNTHFYSELQEADGSSNDSSNCSDGGDEDAPRRRPQVLSDGPSKKKSKGAKTVASKNSTEAGVAVSPDTTLNRSEDEWEETRVETNKGLTEGGDKDFEWEGDEVTSSRLNSDPALNDGLRDKFVKTSTSGKPLPVLCVPESLEYLLQRREEFCPVDWSVKDLKDFLIVNGYLVQAIDLARANVDGAQFIEFNMVKLSSIRGFQVRSSLRVLDVIRSLRKLNNNSGNINKSWNSSDGENFQRRGRGRGRGNFTPRGNRGRGGYHDSETSNSNYIPLLSSQWGNDRTRKADDGNLPSCTIIDWKSMAKPNSNSEIDNSQEDNWDVGTQEYSGFNEQQNNFDGFRGQSGGYSRNSFNHSRGGRGRGGRGRGGFSRGRFTNNTSESTFNTPQPISTFVDDSWETCSNVEPSKKDNSLEESWESEALNTSVEFKSKNTDKPASSVSNNDDAENWETNAVSSSQPGNSFKSPDDNWETSKSNAYVNKPAKIWDSGNQERNAFSYQQNHSRGVRSDQFRGSRREGRDFGGRGKSHGAAFSNANTSWGSVSKPPHVSTISADESWESGSNLEPRNQNNSLEESWETETVSSIIPAKGDCTHKAISSALTKESKEDNSEDWETDIVSTNIGNGKPVSIPNAFTSQDDDDW